MNSTAADQTCCSAVQELKEQLDSTPAKSKESCVALNLVFQLLFQELKDTKRVRRLVKSLASYRNEWYALVNLNDKLGLVGWLVGQSVV